MIIPPTGWVVVPGIDRYTLYPPEGPLAALLRYQERVRPLARLGELVEIALERMSAFAPSGDPVVERLVTNEGEFAALCRIAGTVADQPAQRSLGFVFGDDYYSRFDGLALQPGMFDSFHNAVRDLILHDDQALGVRRRRFLYEPPPGWQPLVRGFITEWIPPRFPRDHAVLTIYPATPAPKLEIAELLNGLVGSNFEIESGNELTTIRTAREMSGLMLAAIGRSNGKRKLRVAAVLAAEGMWYLIDLSAFTVEQWEDHQATLRRLLDSVEPIPRSSAGAAQASNVWAE